MSYRDENKLNSREILFSMDIGTRNVVGVVGKKEDGKFVVIDFEIMDHPSRAMYDGQIHDINRVAEVAKIVKERLEKRLNIPLKQVAIAAAGRALKTYRVQISKEIDYSMEIDNTIIKSLELEGVQKAQQKLENEEISHEAKYYCVGHTVVSYYLNEGVITSLKGHRGSKIGVDIIATFLPYVVVDSLYSVMNKIDLEVINLTLEPIAAIHAAIPPKLRLLNLALVDIGAGTSDIAITKDGTVVAFDMASVAGDELTEAIAKEFLLDFDTAENLKIQLNKKSTHSFSDIVGIPYTMSTDEIIDRIKPTIEILAAEIKEKIVASNGKSPSAVFCIGGGSQIPTLTNYLAEKLNLQKERVVVRGTEIVENLIFQCTKLEGPEFITPIGIGIVSIKDYEQDFIEVLVNDNLVKLFNTKQLSVSDALIRTGYNARKLISRKGNNLIVTINGREKTIQGDLGEAAEIKVNNKLASLETLIKHGDYIYIKDAIDGNNAKATIQELVKSEIVSLNGVEISTINHLLVNGKEVPMNYQVKNGDAIVYHKIITIKELLKKLNVTWDASQVLVNNRLVGEDYHLESGDEVILKTKAEVFVEKDELKPTLEVKVNGKSICLDIKGKPPIFVDIFNYIDFDITKSKGTLKLMLNGMRANYTDLLRDGDQIQIEWIR